MNKEDRNTLRTLLLILTAVIGVSVAFYFLVVSPTVYQSDGLIRTYKEGEMVSNAKVEVVVHKVDTNPVVGEFIWEDRSDIVYVTMGKTSFEGVQVGDTVVLTVDSMTFFMEAYSVTVKDVEIK